MKKTIFELRVSSFSPFQTNHEQEPGSEMRAEGASHEEDDAADTGTGDLVIDPQSAITLNIDPRCEVRM